MPGKKACKLMLVFSRSWCFVLFVCCLFVCFLKTDKMDRACNQCPLTSIIII